jgi:hypothetical protein
MESQHPLNKKKENIIDAFIYHFIYMFKPSQVDKANMGEAELVLYHD